MSSVSTRTGRSNSDGDCLPIFIAAPSICEILSMYPVVAVRSIRGIGWVHRSARGTNDKQEERNTTTEYTHTENRKDQGDKEDADKQKDEDEDEEKQETRRKQKNEKKAKKKTKTKNARMDHPKAHTNICVQRRLASRQSQVSVASHIAYANV